MKLMLLVCIIVSFVTTSWSASKIYPRGCIYWEGRCYRECEEGTHAYAITASYLQPEPTCNDAEPKVDHKIYYDFSACYCDFPTVRDTKTKKCVTIAECAMNLD